MIDQITTELASSAKLNSYENNSLSTERSEFNEVNHVWFHPALNLKLYTDEKNKFNNISSIICV